MRVLLLCGRFNSLSQRFYCELSDKGFEVSVELDVHPDLMIEAVELFRPDLVIAPFLRRMIPPEAYRKVIRTLIVHPGPPGDRGAYSLDWALLEGRRSWGVCILEAGAEYDAGDVYAFRSFELPFKRKSSVYRHQVTEGAVECLWEAVGKIKEGKEGQPQKEGYFRDKPPEELRRIDWEKDTTQEVLRKIYAFDSSPGAVAPLMGEEFLVFNAHEESLLRGRPGEVIAHRGDAVCVGTVDGAVWIGHLRKREKESIKLPATLLLQDRLESVKESSLEPWEDYPGKTYREVVYEERNGISIIHSNFYNGAMSVRHCEELLKALRYAKRRDTKLLILFGSEGHLCHAGERGRGGCLFGADGRYGHSTQGRGFKPSLQEHRQSIRLRVLDLHPPQKGGMGDGLKDYEYKTAHERTESQGAGFRRFGF